MPLILFAFTHLSLPRVIPLIVREPVPVAGELRGMYAIRGYMYV